MMIAETGPGILFNRSQGDPCCFAMWQCTHSIGSEAVKGRLPVIIWYKVTPREYRSLRESIERFIRPVWFGAMYGSVPAMNSGGSGACRSRCNRDAIPKPVSQTP